MEFLSPQRQKMQKNCISEKTDETKLIFKGFVNGFD